MSLLSAPLSVSLLVEPTGMCHKMCWYCDVCSGPKGKHLPLKDAERFIGILQQMQTEDHIVVTDMQLIGGGDALEYPPLLRLSKAAMRLKPNESCLVTAGPTNFVQAVRLSALHRAFPEMEMCISVDPESVDSLRRMDRMLSIALAKRTQVRVRMSPDLDMLTGTLLYQVVLETISSHGLSHYEARFPMKLTSSGPVPMFGRLDFFKDQSGEPRLICGEYPIEPLGRAKIRLKDYLQPLCATRCGELEAEEKAQIVIGWDGLISPCCYGRGQRYPMTYDGVVQLLIERDARSLEVRSTLETHQGELANVCEVCPYYN